MHFSSDVDTRRQIQKIQEVDWHLDFPIGETSSLRASPFFHVAGRLPNGPHCHNPGVRSNCSWLGRVSHGQRNDSGLQIEIVRKDFLKCS